MRTKHLLRLGVGLAVWAGIAGAVMTAATESSMTKYDAVEAVDAYFFQDHFTVVLEYDGVYPAEVGDRVQYPVVLDEVAGLVEYQAIGEVMAAKFPDGGGTELVVWIFPHARHLVRQGTTFTCYSGPDDFQQVVKRLFDDRAKDLLQRQWNRFLAEQGDYVQGQIEPLIRKSLADYMAMVTPDIEAAVTKRQPNFMAIVNRHFNQTVEPKLFPILEQKGMPLVELKLVPILRELGQEMFAKAPKGGFLWGAFRDSLSWGERTKLEEAFNAWMQAEGFTIIEQYKPRIFAAVKEIGGDLADDPDINAVLEEAVRGILKDPALSAEVEAVITEAIIMNPKNSAFFKARWNDPRFQATLSDVGRRLEWYISPVVDSILLDQENQRINPNLVWVLRRQILWKEDFWIIADLPDAAPESPAMQPVPRGHHFRGTSTRSGE